MYFCTSLQKARVSAMTKLAPSGELNLALSIQGRPGIKQNGAVPKGHNVT